ncbi:MAG: FAD:protein FMN transferase [bacterium]|nr:FAD:protein FMN transferase [bacterium]
MEKENSGFTFEGIGTSWCILVDGEPLRQDAKERVLDFIRIFNARFSRFLDNSEVTAYREAGAGEYAISEEFALLLARAEQLRRLTGGMYDPAVGGLLEHAGYGKTYCLTERPGLAKFVLPKWHISGSKLAIDGPVVFDLGGMGKGYCIDRVSRILEDFGYRHYLVDGGGDMYGTSKLEGVPWEVALEYPGKPDMAAGIVKLRNEGLAVSDIFRRRWKGWHHIVDPHLRSPIMHTVGIVAAAGNAWDADCATSAIFLADESRHQEAAKHFGSRYLVFRADGTAHASHDWEGELFT